MTLAYDDAAAVGGRAGRPGYRPGLAKLGIATLVCAGTADPWSNSVITERILAALARPELLLIDGAGHLPNLEAPDEFNQALATFLKAHAPTS